MAFKTKTIQSTISWIVVIFLMAMPNTTDGVIGMNWGRVSAQRLLPTQVVDLLLQNGIKHARIFTSERDILMAFASSGIELTMSVSNPNLFAHSVDPARSWVKWKSQDFKEANARRVIIGENLFNLGFTNKPFLNDAVKSVENTQTALDEAGLDIKVTCTHNIQVLKRKIGKPSEAEFEDAIKEHMIELVRFLEAHDAPFLVNMFPISDTLWLNLDPTFAIPDNKSTQVVTDVNGAVYTNIFEFMYDSFVWALKKINATKIQIIVSQVGWPTDGYEGANTTAAEHFFKSLLPMVISDKGTPMRPGAPIDIFIHLVTDEPKMPLFNAYPFTRHWGIYRSNGQPKYKIDVSGQNRDIYPTEVKGIQRMPDRWCVFNKNLKDIEKVQSEVAKACKTADCTCLSPGGSCSQLSYDQNVSYAFNTLFQHYFQREDICNFRGLGEVTVVDLSTPECLFPVEVVQGQQNNYVAPVVIKSSFGERLHQSPKPLIFLAFLLPIMANFLWD